MRKGLIIRKAKNVHSARIGTNTRTLLQEFEIMKNIIKSVKGTRDFYPAEKAVNSWLYKMIREVSESFGYQEYDGPFLESIDLYAAKSGEELVKEQSFVFPDKNDNLIALRPELTPSLVRMIAQKQRQLYYPLRWWSFGPFWRYESPQKGRGREFFQWNADLIGVDSPEADAEMAALMAGLFQKVGLSSDQVKVFVNNRRLMEQELLALGIPADLQGTVFKVIDRRNKLDEKAWGAYALDRGLDQAQFDGVQKLLTADDLWKKSEELTRFFKAVDALGVSDYVTYSPRIIRGLDYYTGTVVEAQSISADVRRSIAGGGRYDNLLADVGGDPLAGVGFAMGDMVLSVILEEFGLLPEDRDTSPARVMVTIFDQESQLASYQLSAELRKAGLDVYSYPVADKLGKQFRHADRIGAKIALVLGPDEINNEEVAIKDLSSREQTSVTRNEIVKVILGMLENDPAA
ncbi:MAG TPA: histidine--tRNA ligase [Chloroflexi bacterium]|nr:histidine--tRNA ligase [Chloroflexota bacterium]